MVTHWNTSVTQGALLSKYIDEYNEKQNQVEVVLRSDPAASSTEKALLWAATGTMPDILPVSQVNIRTFVQNGIISPMPNDIASIMQRTFMPGALQLTATDGQLWGYPTENMPNAFTYDTVDFNNKGLGDTFPTTWPDLLAVAKRLTTYNEAGAIDRSGLGWNLDFRRNLGLLFALTWAEGGEVFSNDDRTINLLSPEVLNSVNFLVDLIHGQSIVRFGGTHSHSVQAIRWAPGPYVRGTILAESGPDRFAEIRSARIPFGKNGKRIVANYGWVIAVPTATKKAKEVHEFLLWLSTELTERRTTRLGDVLMMLGSIPNTRADVMHQPLSRDPFMQGFIGPLADDEVRSWPILSNDPPILGTVNAALTDIFTGKSPPLQALENAQSKAQQQINESLARK